MKEKLEKALNIFLSLDPESQDRLKKLTHKTIQIELDGLSQNFQLYFFNNKISIKTTDFLVPNVTIKGTPILFIHLSLTKNRSQLFQDLHITGDTLLAQAVIDLFDAMDIDWEEYISHWTNDAAAYQIGNFTRKIKKFRKRFFGSLLQQLNDYIHEEVNFFPPPAECADFFADIDALRLDTDRLAAKIKHLLHTYHKENHKES